MSILAGNLIAKSSFHLQYTLALLPWLNRKDSVSVRCSKDRQYGCSIPVRYIPKKFGESEKSESISRSETQTPNLRRKPQGVEKTKSSPWADTPNYGSLSGIPGSNLFRPETRDVKMNVHGCAIPGEKLSTVYQKSFNKVHMGGKPDSVEEMGYSMGNMDSQLIEEKLEEGDEGLEIQNVGTQDEYRLKECKTKLDAQKVAVELLAARAMTAMELRKKLQVKRFPPKIIDAVLCDFEERGLLNDSLYAETYSRSRWSSSCWGPRRIKQALLKKGVNQVDSEKAVKLVFEDGEDGEQHSRLGLSKSSMDQLYLQASKQWLRSQDAPRDTRKGRIIRWLQYRGFDWGVVNAILKKLESQSPP